MHIICIRHCLTPTRCGSLLSVRERLLQADRGSKAVVDASPGGLHAFRDWVVLRPASAARRG